MKKRVMALVAVVIVLCMLVGCAKDADNQTDEGSMKYCNIIPEDYVTLGEYKNLEITIAGTRYVSDTEVETQALAWYQQFVTLENGAITNRAVEVGDIIIIDYVGKKDGIAFEGGSADDVMLLVGSGAFIDGFEDGLIDTMPGESVDLNLTFPEDYQSSELAGQEVVFTVKVHYIIPSEMQDSVVAGFGSEKYDTVEEFLQHTRKQLEEYYEVAYRENVEKTIYSRIYSNSTYKEFSEELLSQRMEHVSDSIEADAQAMNMNAETLIKNYYGMEKTEFLKQVAQSYLQHILTAYAIAEQENILQTRKELEQAMEQYASEKGFATMEEMMLSGYTREELEEMVITEAVFDFLLENTTIKTVIN